MHTDNYEHRGKSLDSEIAAEFIFTKYCGHEVSEFDISRELLEHHKAGGGLAPTENLFNDFNTDEVYNIVKEGLDILKVNRCASFRRVHPIYNGFDKVSDRVWAVHAKKEISAYPQTIGEGSESVYLYYCPAYKERAESRFPAWKNQQVPYECNIGRSTRTATTRVNEKIKNLPEKPILALTIKTDKSELLEKIIHTILIYHDRQCEDANRTDWFYTTPEEVEKIFKAVAI